MNQIQVKTVRRFYRVDLMHDSRRYYCEVEALTEAIALTVGAAVIGARIAVPPSVLEASQGRSVQHQADIVLEDLPYITIGEAKEQHGDDIVDRMVEEVQNANARRFCGETHHVILSGKGKVSITVLPVSHILPYLENGLELVGDYHLTQYQTNPHGEQKNASPEISKATTLELDATAIDASGAGAIAVNTQPRSARARRRTDSGSKDRS